MLQPCPYSSCASAATRPLRSGQLTSSVASSCAMSGLLEQRAACAHGSGEVFEHRQGLAPAQARIGDALPVLQRLPWLVVLAAFVEMALHHHAKDTRLALGDLLRDGVHDLGLIAMI